MKKLLFPLFLALTLIVSAANVPPALALTLDQVTGTWQNVVGGTNINFPTVGTEVQVRWGTSVGYGQSGLGFAGSAPPQLTFDPEDAFMLGTLTHYNNPISGGTAASSVQLVINLDFSVPEVNPSFTFTFNINETPNTTGDDWLDRDFIYFPSSFPTETFTIGDTIYTLKLLGFGASADNLQSQFESPENGSNSTYLWGTITTEVVPLPGSVWLLGSGLPGLIWFSRRRLFG